MQPEDFPTRWNELRKDNTHETSAKTINNENIIVSTSLDRAVAEKMI
jgi:hypothetical protein